MQELKAFEQSHKQPRLLIRFNNCYQNARQKTTRGKIMRIIGLTMMMMMMITARTA